MPERTSNGMSSTPRTPFFETKVPATIRLRPGSVTTWRWSCLPVNWEKAISARLPLPPGLRNNITRLRCYVPPRPDPLARHGRLHSAFPRFPSIGLWSQVSRDDVHDRVLVGRTRRPHLQPDP